MRIVHVIDSIDPAQGGPSFVAPRLAAAQAALGHDVALIGGCATDRIGVVRDFLDTGRGLDAVDVVRVDRRPGRIGRLITRGFRQALLRLTRQGGADVVHLHGVWDAPLLRVARLCRSRRIPYVVQPHGMLDDWTLAQKSWKKSLGLRLAHGPMLRHAAAVHALNAHEKACLVRMFPEASVHVIGNGVFLEDIDAPVDANAFRGATPALGDRPYVLFLSRLHYKKGLDLLAEAWARVAADFPEHRLVIAGRRDDDSIEDFRSRMVRAGLSDAAIEVGEIYGDVKASAFAGCACFVLPSRQEGFSVAVTESLGYGAPVVITDQCHFPEVEEEGAGIVTTLDIPDIARGLHRMLSDDELRASCAERGRRLVRERYTWPRIAEAAVEMYEEEA